MKTNTRRTKAVDTVDEELRLGWRAGLFFALVLLTVSTTAAGIYQVRESYEITRMGMSLEQERVAQRDLMEEAKRLRLRIEAHKHPARVIRKAVDMDMKPARTVDEFLVPNGQVDGMRPQNAPGGEP